MAKFIIKQHQRGNHTAKQVFYHGSTVFEGTKKECLQEWKRMKKFCKEKFHNTSTNEKIRDFIAYEMADIWMLKIKENEINFV